MCQMKLDIDNKKYIIKWLTNNLKWVIIKPSKENSTAKADGSTGRENKNAR